MKFLLCLCCILGTSSCTPEFFKSAEEVLNNDAITVKVDKDAFQKETDVHVIVDVNNKDVTK